MTSSRIVYRPELQPHFCRPGWTVRVITEEGKFGPPVGSRVLVSPTPWNYPPGTIIVCECGKRFTSIGAIAVNAPGMCYFEPEGWFARWRRERRIRRAQDTR